MWMLVSCPRTATVCAIWPIINSESTNRHRHRGIYMLMLGLVVPTGCSSCRQAQRAVKPDHLGRIMMYFLHNSAGHSSACLCTARWRLRMRSSLAPSLLFVGQIVLMHPLKRDDSTHIMVSPAQQPGRRERTFIAFISFMSLQKPPEAQHRNLCPADR